MLRLPLIKLLTTGGVIATGGSLASFAVNAQSKSLPKVYFDIETNGKSLGRITMEVSLIVFIII